MSDQQPALTPSHWVPRYPNLLNAVVFAVVALLGKVIAGGNSAPNGIDPWLYVSYGQDYAGVVARYGWTYYASRLPWNLYLALNFHLWGQVISLYVVGVSVVVIGAMSLFSILEQQFNRTTAFITAFCLASNYWFYSHSYWFYVDGPVIALSFCSMALAMQAFRQKDLSNFVMAGIVFDLAVNMHPIAVFLAPPALVAMAYFEPNTSMKETINGALAFVAGAVVTNLVLCSVSWMLFRVFWFELVTVNTVDWVVTGGWHEWVKPFWTWAFKATALSVPAAMLLLSVALYWREFITRKLPSSAWIPVYGLFTALCIAVSDGIFHGGRLQHTYYFIYLWTPTFLLLGLVIDRFVAGFSENPSPAVIAAVVVALLPLTFANRFLRSEPLGYIWIVFMILAVMLVFIAFCLFSKVKDRRQWRIAGVAATIGFVSLASACDLRHAVGAPDLKTVEEGQALVTKALVPEKPLLIWYNNHARLADELIAISSENLFGYSRFSGTLPTATEDEIHKITQPTTMVLLDDDMNRINAAVALLKQRGLVSGAGKPQYAGRPDRRIIVYIMEVTWPGASAPAK